MDTRPHIVLGAGPVGRATACALLARGERVVIANRSGRVPALPPGARPIALDLADRDAAVMACAGARSIYFCAQPPYHRWPKLFPPLMDAAIAAAAATGARLVVADNLYAYGRVDGPMTEATPIRPVTRKGRVRAAMLAALAEAEAAGRIKAAIARAADLFGPGVEGSAAGLRLFRAIAAGRRVTVGGDPDQPHSYTFIGDFGAALAILGTDPRGPGQAWHVPNAPAVSTRHFLGTAARLAGRPLRLRAAGRAEMALLGLLIPAVRESIEMLYEFEHPFVVDHARFASAFGDIATPIEAALAATLASLSG